MKMHGNGTYSFLLYALVLASPVRAIGSYEEETTSAETNRSLDGSNGNLDLGPVGGTLSAMPS
jgi:hypothetical protein